MIDSDNPVDDRRRSRLVSRFFLSPSISVKVLPAIGLAVFGLVTVRVVQDTKAEPLIFLSVIAIVVSVLLGIVTIGHHILNPLDRAARHGRHPTQFTMADFLALVFLLQLPAALIRQVVPSDAPPIRFIYGFAWVASSLMWGLSVQTLSRAGIATPWRRVVFLSVVLPIAYFGSLVFIVSVLMGCGTILFDGGTKQITRFWWCLAVGATSFLGFRWAGSFVRAMVAESPRDKGRGPL